MSYQVLARKWRPRNFDEVLGQAHVVRALGNGLELGRLHHAYLFAGTRGVGKTTLARILAKCLNCEAGVTAKPCGECSACKQIDEGRFVDLSEIDAASRTGVDDMRELLEDVHYAPSAGRFKIYLIDEVHMLSSSSFNALLKTLEEPPDHVKFFFATTHPQKLPVTILSRCLRFNLTRLLPDEIEEYLAAMLKTESVSYEEAALKQIAIAAEGSVRDSLSLLDQAIAYGNGSLNTQEVETMLGLAARDEVFGLLHCVAQNDAAGLFERIENMYRKAVDFTSVLGDLIELLHAVALHQTLPDAKPPAQFGAEEMATLAAEMTPEDVQLFYQIALNGKRDLPFLPNARNAFEMTMLRMLSFRLSEETVPAGKGGTKPIAPPAPVAESALPLQETPAPASGDSRKDQRAPPEGDGAGQTMTKAADTDADAANSGAGGTIKLADFEGAEAWSELINQLQLAGAQREICLNSVFSVQSENEVTLVLDKQLDSIKTPERENKIRAALVQAAGREIKVNFKLASLDQKKPQQADQETPQQADQRKQLQRQLDAENSIENSPLVQSLKNNFDASVVPGSTKPTE